MTITTRYTYSRLAERFGVSYATIKSDVERLGMTNLFTGSPSCISPKDYEKLERLLIHKRPYTISDHLTAYKTGNRLARKDHVILLSSGNVPLGVYPNVKKLVDCVKGILAKDAYAMLEGEASMRRYTLVFIQIKDADERLKGSYLNAHAIIYDEVIYSASKSTSEEQNLLERTTERNVTPVHIPRALHEWIVRKTDGGPFTRDVREQLLTQYMTSGGIRKDIRDIIEHEVGLDNFLDIYWRGYTYPQEDQKFILYLDKNRELVLTWLQYSSMTVPFVSIRKQEALEVLCDPARGDQYWTEKQIMKYNPKLMHLAELVE